MRLFSPVRRGWWLIGGAVILAAVFAFDLTPWVRGGFGWRWEYDPAPSSPLGFVLCLLGYIVVAAWLLHRRARPRTLLAYAFIAAAAFPFIAAALRGEPLYVMFSRIFSEVASHHMVGAASVDWVGGEWRDWPSVMGRIGSHVGTSPPGLLLAYGLVTDLADKTGLAAPFSRPLISALCTDYKLYDLTPAEIASGWFGVLYPVWAALAVFPLYALGKKIGTRPEWPLLLWPLVPGLSGFATSNSTLFPLLALLMMWALVGHINRWRAALAGLIFGVAIFINLALLPLAGLAGYFVLGRWLSLTPRPSLTQPITSGVFFALGALIPWGIWWLLTGDTPLDILRQSFDYHLELERPYWFWVWFHVWDWAVWGGLMIFIGAGAILPHLWRGRHHNPDAAGVAIAVMGTVLTLTISGITRGESGRIWLFLAPFVLVLWAVAPPSSWRWRDLALAQGVLTCALIFAVDAFNAPDVPPVPPLSGTVSASPIAEFYEDGQPAFAILNAQARLEGEGLRLDLTVVGRTPPLRPAWFGMTLVAPDGAVWPSEPLQPLDQTTGERLPATCWAHGNTAHITLRQRLDPLPPAGDGYYVSISVYDYRTNGAVWSVNGTSETHIGLGAFRLGETP